jgi:hypothetical protein
MVENETMTAREAFQFGVEATLKRVGNHHVSNRATDLTHQMMMMSRQILCEFESCEFIGGLNPTHHTGTLENRQIPIRRTLRQATRFGDLSDGQWMFGGLKDFDESSTARGVAMTVPS